MNEHITFLSQQLNEYHPAFHDFRNGKNKKIRDDGERRSDNIRLIVENYLNTHDDLHQEFAEYFPGFAYGEALSWQYFGRDFPRFIRHLKGLE